MKEKVVHFSEINEDVVSMEGAKNVFIRWLVSENDEAPNFYMRVFTIRSGGHTPYHKHNYEHEVYVLEGEGVVILEDKEYPIRSGFVVTVPPDLMHQFKNNTSADLKFICIIPKV